MKELEPTGEITTDENGNIVFTGTMKFQPMVQKDEYLQLNNRLDLLFVDYNEKEAKWQTWKDKQLPLWSQFERSLAAFKRETDKWISINGFHVP